MNDPMISLKIPKFINAIIAQNGLKQNPNISDPSIPFKCYMIKVIKYYMSYKSVILFSIVVHGIKLQYRWWS